MRNEQGFLRRHVLAFFTENRVIRYIRRCIHYELFARFGDIASCVFGGDGQAVANLQDHVVGYGYGEMPVGVSLRLSGRFPVWEGHDHLSVGFGFPMNFNVRIAHGPDIRPVRSGVILGNHF